MVVAQPLFVLTFIQSIVINWGVAIILLTVLAACLLPALSYRLLVYGRMRKSGPHHGDSRKCQ